MFGSINDFVEKMSGSSDYTAALTTLLILIIILIIYLVVFKLGTTVIGYMMDWKGDPYIIRGKEEIGSIDTTHYYTNPLDYEQDNVRVILRSNNERNGIEFTWATWLYVDANKMISNKTDGSVTSSDKQCGASEWDKKDKLYSIFNKGSHVNNTGSGSNAMLTTTNADKKHMPQSGIVDGLAVMTCPGLYLKYSNTSSAYLKERYRKKIAALSESGNPYDELDKIDPKIPDESDQGKNISDPDELRNRFEYVVTCNTMSEKQLMETVTVPNIPLNLWTYVVIRCMNHKLDVYINGRIKKRVILSGLPRQNYGDLYVCERNGHGRMEGEISNLRYFNYALQARTIEYFTEKGPNLDPVQKPKSDQRGKPYYLTQRWHYTDYLR